LDDINFGLQYPEASFDIVHGRFLAGGINNWDTTITEMYRVLAATGKARVQLTELRPGLRCDDDSVPADAASASWPDIFFTQGHLGDRLGTSKFDEIAMMLKRRLEAAGFVDIEEFIEKAPVGGWYPGISLKETRIMVDSRLTEIGTCMAKGWLGFLESFKTDMIPHCGSAAAVDEFIAKVRNDYSTPNYHGYNLIYVNCG
jgi:hypothetical protein